MDPQERMLLERCWFPVARLADVGGKPVAAAVLDVRLVVFAVAGEITVADAACPHRGADLSMGAVTGGRLECPYHGWAYEPGSGRCALVPSRPDVPPPPRSTLRVRPSRIAYGHVWCCLADEPALPFPVLPDAGLPGWEYGYGEPVDLRCGMRQLTENFRDMAHFPYVHGGTMGTGVRREVDPYEVAHDGADLEWTLATDLGGEGLEGNSGVASRQTLTYHLTLPMTAWIRTRFDDGGGRLVAQMATPISACGERVRQFWIVGVDEVVREQHGVSLQRMWEYERDVFAEDHPIVENQIPPEAPLTAIEQAHTRADAYSLVYRRVYRSLLAGIGGPASTPAARHAAAVPG